MIHQPHFLPWPGYLARSLAADVFVALDNVKFNRNHFQQRTKFIDHDANLRWLSLPIEGVTRSGLISNVKIAPDFSLKKWERPVIESYRDALFFEQTWRGITDVISSHHPDFCSASLSLLEKIVSRLCNSLSRPKVEFLRASQIEASNHRTMRLVDICRDQGITHLIMGNYALDSHNISLLNSFEISLMRHIFIGPKDLHPIPGVMCLHYILRDGWERAAIDLTSHWILQKTVEADS